MIVRGVNLSHWILHKWSRLKYKIMWLFKVIIWSLNNFKSWPSMYGYMAQIFSSHSYSKPLLSYDTPFIRNITYFSYSYSNITCSNHYHSFPFIYLFLSFHTFNHFYYILLESYTVLIIISSTNFVFSNHHAREHMHRRAQAQQYCNFMC